MSSNPPKHPLKSVIYPRSIAVIGASGTPGKIGYQILKNAIDQGYKGKIFPINPSESEIMGLKAHANVNDVPEEIDLACIIVPNNVVPQVVEECGKKGVKGVIIYAGGFAEIGEKGAELQRKIVEAASKYGLRVLGPNINGMFNGSISLNVSFNQFKTLDGPAAIVSQSGSFASGVVFESIRCGFGFNKFIILGNRADVNEIEALDFLSSEPDVKGIAMYLESISDERSFIEVAARTTKQKPIVCVKAGVSDAGVRAIKYTTASEVKGDPFMSSIFKESGVVMVKDGEELVDALFALIHQPLPRGNRVGIVTNSGGIAVILTDRLGELGMKVPHLSEPVRQKLSKIMLPIGSAHNPVDLTGSVTKESFRDSLTTLIESGEVDLVIATAIRSLFLPLEIFEGAYTEAAEIARRNSVPFLVCMMGDDKMFDLFSSLRSKGIPCYPSPERAAKSAYHLYEYSKVREIAA
ncbi:MAG: CoA-binding protein [Aigarchaeota archaeon]|nr:CoA-binding protein [Aigarchaeota archaeon]MDW8092782.1 CoA-binding protein [Nitrososphaerota archaeon]